MIRIGKKVVAALVMTSALGMVFAGGKKDTAVKKAQKKPQRHLSMTNPAL